MAAAHFRHAHTRFDFAVGLSLMPGGPPLFCQNRASRALVTAPPLGFSSVVSDFYPA